MTRGRKLPGIILACSMLLSAAACGSAEGTIEVTPKSAGDWEESAPQNEICQKETGSLRDKLGAPEHYTAQAADESGNFRLEVDADVFIPQVDAVQTVEVAEQEVDDAFVRKFADVFLKGAVFYDAEAYYQPTIATVEEKIAGLREELETGNYDKEKFGVVDGERKVLSEQEYRAYLEEQIKRLEERKKELPETVECDPVTPRISDADTFGNYYAAKAGEEEYFFTVKNFCGYMLRIRHERGGDLQWADYGGDERGSEFTQEEMTRLAGITYDEAEAAVKGKLESLGLADIGIADGNFVYTVKIGEGESLAQEGGRGAYAFHCIRTVDGVPLTYTDMWGGALPDMDADWDTWMYERLEIIYSGDGVEEVQLQSPYALKAGSGREVQLLPFDDVMEVFQSMMLVGMGDLASHENWRTYRIGRITLGYSRIYDPMVSDREGRLVPVWDFFGEFECESSWNGEKTLNRNTERYSSRLTINAIDGSVIDRGLGY